MTRSFIELPLFRSKWEDLGLTDLDLRKLQSELLSEGRRCNSWYGRRSKNAFCF